MKSAMAAGDAINQLDALIRQIKDKDEKKEFVKALGQAMGHLADIIFKIARVFPELDPDK
jgi:hypothetical protein